MKFKKVLIPLVLVSFMTACADGTSTSNNSVNSGLQNSSSENLEQGDKVLQDALAKLKQDVEFSGSYELVDSTATYVHEVTAVFTETKYLSRDIYYNSEIPELKYLQANDILSYEDGSINLILRNIDNTITKYDVTEDYKWSQFQNPFFKIEEKDFTLISKGKYSLDLTKGLDAGIAISGWSHTSCKTFNIEVLENNIELQFVLDGVDGEVTYNFVASKFGTATVDIEPFERKSSHDKLSSALASIGENYTMHILDQAYNGTDEDINQTIYKTETQYFDEFDKIGYFKTDSAVKTYSLTDGQVTKYEDADEDNPFENLLELNTIAPEIFEEVEPNVFVVKALDLAYGVVSAFSNNSDNKLLGDYFALDAKITLTNEGALDKFEYNYDAYGFASHRIVTFENIDSTVIPSYVEDALEAYEQEQQSSTIPEKFIGKFEGVLNDGDTTVQINGSNKLQIEITNSEITINGIVAEIVEYDPSQDFTIRIDGVTYYLGTNDNEEPSQELWFSDKNYEVYCYSIPRVDDSSSNEESVVIPEKFIGKFEGVLNEGAQINGSNNLQIEITNSEITINGIVVEIVEYDPSEDFTIRIDGVTYYLGASDNEEPSQELWFADINYEEAYCYSIPRV